MKIKLPEMPANVVDDVPQHVNVPRDRSITPPPTDEQQQDDNVRDEAHRASPVDFHGQMEQSDHHSSNSSIYEDFCPNDDAELSYHRDLQMVVYGSVGGHDVDNMEIINKIDEEAVTDSVEECSKADHIQTEVAPREKRSTKLSAAVKSPYVPFLPKKRKKHG